VGVLSRSAYVSDKSELSEVKRVCDIAIGNSCNLALVVDNLDGDYWYLQVRPVVAILA
jgi:hypothetical protein